MSAQIGNSLDLRETAIELVDEVQEEVSLSQLSGRARKL